MSEVQSTHDAECWKAHPQCCRARLDQAIELLKDAMDESADLDGVVNEDIATFLVRIGLFHPSVERKGDGE